MDEQVLVDGHHGIYVPQVFASKFDPNKFGVESFDPDYQCILHGPGEEYYWESWDALLEKASYKDENGVTWYLNHDGDLFLVSNDAVRIFY